MKKRSLVIAVLSALSLTMILAVPTNSLVGYYDPWLDYDDNGNIDMKDVAASAKAFGSYGDPTKNVNVMNWPASEQVVVWWNEPFAPADHRWSDTYDSSGFSQLHILFFIDGLTIGEKLAFWVHGIMWREDHLELIYPTYHYAIYTWTNSTHIFSLTVPSQTFNFYVGTDGSTDANVYLNFYLTWA